MHYLSLSIIAFVALASQGNAQQTYAWKGKYPSALYDPKLGHIPIAPTNTPEVTAWLAAINMSAVPNIPLATTVNNDGYTLVMTPGMKDACDWSYDPSSPCDKTDIQICPTVGDWGLTYDDGPTQWSGMLYDYLDSIQQKATLFYIGAAVYNYPTFAKRGCTSMHQIGLHTWSHHLLTTLTNEQIVAELKYTEMIIKELCGFTPRYMRPPFGDIDDRVRALMSQMGYIPVIWDYDTNDWNIVPAPGATLTGASVDADFTKWIANRGKDTAGHICLEHELYNTSVAESIKWLPQLKKSYNVMTVQACVRDPYPYVEKNFVFPIADTAGVNLINSTQMPGNGTSVNNTAIANSSVSATGNASMPAASGSATGSGASSAAGAATTGKSGATTLTISTVAGLLSIATFFYTLM